MMWRRGGAGSVAKPRSRYRSILAALHTILLVVVASEDDTVDSCTALTDCGSCGFTSASYYCHWCAQDEACHSVFDYTGGCWYGVQDCRSIERCARDEPERVGRPPGSVRTTSAVALASFVAALAYSLLKQRRSSNKNNDDDEITHGGELYGLYREGVPHYGSTCAPRVRSSSSSPAATAITTTSSYWYLASSSALLAAALAYTASVVPRVPEVNFCSGEVAWKSVLQGIVYQQELSATFDLLFSVYNPNPYDVGLNTARGDFLLDGEAFGTFEVRPLPDVRALSVTDDLVTVTLSPSESQVTTLIKRYFDGSLRFGVDAELAVTVFPNHWNYTYTTRLEDLVVDLSYNETSEGTASDAATEVDRHLCACP